MKAPDLLIDLIRLLLAASQFANCDARDFPWQRTKALRYAIHNVFFPLPVYLDLNLSYNKMSALPDEVSKCSLLETVDISHNSFISLPSCLLNLPKILKINAKKNFIAGMKNDL